MKIKKLIAVFMSAATLAAMPVSPVLGDIWQKATVTAEAATTPTNYYKYTTGGICYELDTANKEAYIYSYTGKPTNLVVRATVNYANGAYKIVAIRDNAFNGCYTLNTVDLSSASNLRSIGQSAFRYSSVKYVYINSSVTVGQYAFANTSELQSATLQAYGQTVTVMPNAFASSAIQNFYGYAPTIYLQRDAFFQCRNLNYVCFNSNVRTLSFGNGLFHLLGNLKTVRIEGTNTQLYLEPSVFCSSGINSITLPNTVTSIPADCFNGCHLTNFSMPDSVKSIGAYAFGSATLPATFKISKGIVSISDSAFTSVSGVKAFTIDQSNSYFKTYNGVLYNKSGTKLIKYPTDKTDSTFVCYAKYYPSGCISNNPYLETLTLKNYTPYSNGGVVDFPQLPKLKNLNVPTSLSGTTIMTYFHKLFLGTKLQKINNKQVLYTPSGKEPYFHADYSEYINQHFDQLNGSDILNQYNDKMEDWVISQVITSGMTPIEKIMKLRKWIMDRTTYDPRVLENLEFHDMKNQCTASVFLHKEKLQQFNYTERYVTVCEGYAECFTGLLNKVGIEAHTVIVPMTHAWNLVKLNGKWYHMDITWDDQTYDSGDNKNRFKYCLVSDELINNPNDGHGSWFWFTEENNTNLTKNFTVATMDNTQLGDVDGNKIFNTADVTKLKSYYGTTNAKYLALCDLNFDGKVNSTDAGLLQDFVNTYYKQYDTPRIWRFSYYEQ